MAIYKLGQLGGLEVRAQPTVLLGSVGVWALWVAITATLLRASLLTAALSGLIALALYWFSEMVHQLGHAWAARSTGYPMTGVRLWWVLGTSVYPADEPALPTAVHIRRALGGPLLSAALAVLAGISALLLRAQGGVLGWLAVFVFADNLLFYTLQALIPLGFNDGATLWHWWRRRKSSSDANPRI